MTYFLVSPNHFAVEPNMLTENPYMESDVDLNKAKEQHKELCNVLKTKPLTIDAPLPDVVFAANAGLSLPRLPTPTIVLSRFKYPVRQQETKHLKKAFRSIGYDTVDFPGPCIFEGQGECIWFYGGKLLVFGYGYRSSVESVGVLRKLLEKIYRRQGVEPPMVLGVELSSPYFYHLDLAALKTSEASCVCHAGCFTDDKALREVVDVTPWRTDDPFLLNTLVTPRRVVTHRLKNAKDRRFLSAHFPKHTLVEVDSSEFQKSGGSIQCMVLSLF
jgi:N-dimethylarginine dimethylaminohydrolase